MDFAFVFINKAKIYIFSVVINSMLQILFYTTKYYSCYMWPFNLALLSNLSSASGVGSI